MNEQNQMTSQKRSNRKRIFWLGGISFTIIICCLLIFLRVLNVNSANSQKARLQQARSVPTELPATATPATYNYASFDISPEQLTKQVITRLGQMDIIAENVDAVALEVEKIIVEYSDRGAILRDRVDSRDEVSIRFRIPVDEFDSVMDYLAGQANKVSQRGEVVESYKAEYMDLETHLKSLEAVRDRLIVLSKQSVNLEEVMRIEQLIKERDAEIEATNGNIRFLSESTQLAEISLTIFKNDPHEQTVSSPASTQTNFSGSRANEIYEFSALSIESAKSVTKQNLDIQPATQSLIAYTGTMTLRVSNTQDAIKEIQKIIAASSGEGALIFDRADRYYYDDPISDLKICVPATKIAEVMNSIAQIPIEAEDRRIRSEDVTAKYSELESRLIALEMTHARLINNLNRSANANQVLLIEQQLSRQDAEVISIKGQMKLLVESGRLSEITLIIYPYRTFPETMTPTPVDKIMTILDNVLNWFFSGKLSFIDLLLGLILLSLLWLLIGNLRTHVPAVTEKTQKGN